MMLKPLSKERLDDISRMSVLNSGTRDELLLQINYCYQELERIKNERETVIASS